MSIDKTLPTHIVVGRTKSYGAAFSAVNILDKNKFEVLELFPVGTGGHLVLEVLATDMATAQSHFNDLQARTTANGIGFSELEYFPDIEDAILDAYLSLHTPEMKDAGFTIVESESLSQVIKASKKLIELGGQIFDLRFLKGSEPKAFCLVTGLKNKPSMDLSDAQLTFISDVNDVLFEYLQSVKRIHRI